MTNKEKFAKEILDIACTGSGIAMDFNGKLVPCIGFVCGNCKFNGGCDKSIKEWCESEYIGKPKISKSDRLFLEYISEQYEWLARDKSGNLYAYIERPIKEKHEWITLIPYGRFLVSIFKVSFEMIKWKDTEPWLIDDLKKLEVEP